MTVTQIQEERSSQYTRSDKSSKDLLNQGCGMVNRSQRPLFVRQSSLPVCLEEVYSKERSTLISRLRSNRVNKWFKSKMLNCLMPSIKNSDKKKKSIKRNCKTFMSEGESLTEMMKSENGIIRSKVEMDDETVKIVEEVVSDHGGWIVIGGDRLRQMESRLNKLKV